MDIFHMYCKIPFRLLFIVTFTTLASLTTVMGDINMFLWNRYECRLKITFVARILYPSDFFFAITFLIIVVKPLSLGSSQCFYRLLSSVFLDWKSCLKDNHKGCKDSNHHNRISLFIPQCISKWLDKVVLCLKHFPHCALVFFSVECCSWDHSVVQELPVHSPPTHTLWTPPSSYPDPWQCPACPTPVSNPPPGTPW